MNRKILAGMVAFSLWGASASQMFAAEPLLNELYGQGVHAFNEHNYEEAYENLTAAIDQGSQDPRVYYFRGLVFTNTGRPDAAKADFAKAAMLEVTNDNQVYNVGKALTRIQGAIRLDIEKYRLDARIAVSKSQSNAAQVRYEKAQADEAKVIRKPVGGVANTAPMPMAPMPAAEGTPDPFAGGVGVGEAEVAPEKVVEKPMAPMGVRDPFAEAPVDPAATTPAADPFAPKTPMPADPFGGADAGTPAPTPMPMPAAEDDPFGGGTPAPKPMPAPMPAPAAEDDPFGGSAPAPKPAPAAEADPFGGDAAPAPAPKPAPAAEDPFGDDPKPDPMPAPPKPAPAPAPADDPFGAATDPAAAPAVAEGGTPGKKTFFGKLFGAGVKALPGSGSAAAPAANTTPAAPAADPFGGAAPAPAAPSNDPFAEPAPAPKAAPQPAPGNDPFADPAPAAPAPANDPFAEPAPAPKAAPQPAPADDPFAEPAPDKKPAVPADDNPFG